MMRSLRAKLALVLVAAAALAVGLGVALWSQAPERADRLLALTLPDAQGTPQPLSQWRGKVLVVNFWATWCEPCREEMPEFIRAQAEYGPKGLQFVGIAADPPDKVLAFAKELGLNYPALIAGYDAIDLSREFGNRLLALPFTVIIDREGRVAHTQLGPLEKVQLLTIINKLL